MLNIFNKIKDYTIEDYLKSFFYVSKDEISSLIFDLLITKKENYFNELKTLNNDNDMDKTKNINDFIGLINISSIKDELNEKIGLNEKINIDEIFILPKNTNKDDFIKNVIKDKYGLINFLILFTKVMYKYHNSNKIHFSNGENSKDYLFLRNKLIKNIKQIYFKDFINKQSIIHKNNYEYNEKTFQKAINTGQFIVTDKNEIIFNVYDIKTKFFHDNQKDENKLYDLAGALIYMYYNDVLDDDNEIKHHKDKLLKNYNNLELKAKEIQENFKKLEEYFKKIQYKYTKDIELTLLKNIKNFLFPQKNMNDIQGILDFQNLWEELCGQHYIKDKEIIFVDIESYDNKIDKLKQYFDNINIKIVNNNIVINKSIERNYFENDKLIKDSYIIEDKTIRPDLIYKDNNIVYIKDFKNWNMNNITDLIKNHKKDIEKQEQYIDLLKNKKNDNNSFFLNERSIFIVPYYDNIDSKLTYKNIDIKNYNLDELNNISNEIKVEKDNIEFKDVTIIDEIITLGFGKHKDTNIKDIDESYLFWVKNNNTNVKIIEKIDKELNRRRKKESLENDLKIIENNIDKYKQKLFDYENMDNYIKIEYLNWYDLMESLTKK